MPYSSVVSMFLLYRGATLCVAQCGPDFVILDRPAEFKIPKGKTGTLAIKVDRTETLIPVRFPSGIALGVRRIPIAKA